MMQSTNMTNSFNILNDLRSIQTGSRRPMQEAGVRIRVMNRSLIGHAPMTNDHVCAFAFRLSLFLLYL
jgi:hypothetical protein